MEDVGQRVVMDVRDQLYGHILGQSASFFGAQRRRPAAVARVERRRAGAARGVGDRRRSAAGNARAGRLRRHPVLHRPAARARVPDRRAHHLYPLVRLGQRIRRTARRSQEAQEHMSHVGAETFAAHRIVKAFGAEEREAEPLPRRAAAICIARTCASFARCR